MPVLFLFQASLNPLFPWVVITACYVHKCAMRGLFSDLVPLWRVIYLYLDCLEDRLIRSSRFHRRIITRLMQEAIVEAVEIWAISREQPVTD
jgi:hypothetical protein